MTERDYQAEIESIVARHKAKPGALLPVLNDVQEAFGHIDDAAKRQVAEALNLSRAEVHGVVSFYHDFRNKASGKPAIKLCRAEACQARGSEALAQAAERIANGRVTIEPVYCLGLCAVGPNAMIGKAVHARLNEVRLADLIEGSAA